ncbi:MAG: ComF family protein [Bacteroidaceae bacterium]|nr:ComF family protein [Bacteroidaceae bacterium]
MKILSSVTDFLLPRYCKVCGRRLSVSEEHLCIGCYIGLPIVEYDFRTLSRTETLLLSERNIVRASSLLQYDKESDYRKILFHLKYWGHPEVGSWMATIGARKLGDAGFFVDVDFIIPLPLTRRRLRKRGYNQCMYIANGIRKVTGLPVVEHAVIRHEDNRSHQAGLGLFQRWSNAQGIFQVIDPEPLRGKHILLVDDVLTTGSTLCSLIGTLNQSVPDIRVSVFTLAITI